VTREPPDSSGTAGERCTCTACPLLCDDILIAVGGVERACRHGGAVIQAALAADEWQDARQTGPRTGPQTGPQTEAQTEAWEGDRPLDRQTATRRAAALLTAARRVLVTGLANGTLEAITAACDLAETLNAAIDSCLPESARATGPTIARAGEVTAAWEELRDRADLVIFWCCDPSGSHPRFIERFVAPLLADGRRRRTIAVGPDGVLPATALHRHLPLARDRAVEAARWLQLRIGGRHTTRTDTPLFDTCIAVEEAIQSAGCVALVTADADDPVGLEAWSTVHLVRTIAHEKQAFQIPLGAGIAAGGVNGAGAAAACTWRYGAAGGIARADRSGSLFLPGEADARHLISRGEVDAVVILGRLSERLEQAIADRGDVLSLVRISDAAEMPRKPTRHGLHIRAASGALATSGTMLREDGRRVVLAPHRPAALPQMRELIIELCGAVRRSPAVPSAGGRP